MQQLLEKFCLSEKENGLLLVDMPTGTGKTYNAAKFICNNYKKCKGKIIFITNLKKNLPFNELKKCFEEIGRLDDYEKDVLFLDNNVDCLIENFEKVRNEIPTELFSKKGVLDNIKKTVSIITTLKASLDKEKDKDIKGFDSIGSKENVYFIINQAREDLIEKYEKAFRTVIEEALTYTDDKKKRTKADKLELIKNDSKYNWIGKLYPSVYTDEKKIILMSIDKFLVRNSTIIEPSYNIIDNYSLLKNSLIFIDEFDSSKEVFLKNIIQEAVNTKISIVELFRIIYAGLSNTNFSKLLTNRSQYLDKKIEEKSKKIYTPDELLKEFTKRAEEIDEKYFLVNYHKLEAKEKDKSNFLFQDYKFHTILGDRNSNIYIENDKENNINWIKNNDDKNKLISENENIFSLLKEIKSFLTYFENGIKFIADNYVNLKRERNQETNNFSYEAAVKTVLAEFGIEGKYLNYLATQIMNNKKKRDYKIGDLKSELDSSVYEKGFRYYNFIDSDVFDTQSKVNYLSFNLTPEKILLYLCSTAKVIGISASGTLETVTGNYDLNYIKAKLDEGFYNIEPEDQSRIDRQIDQQLGNYENVNIQVKKCEITDANYEELLINLFPNSEDFNTVIAQMNSWQLSSFQKSRYVKLFFAMSQFFENSIPSYLFLTNVGVGNGIDFNYTFIQDVFKLIKKQYGRKGYCYPLGGTLERFESTKEKIKNKLKEGNKLFVISTYQTLGAGQNLQYEYVKNAFMEIEEINNNPYGKDQKDFDAIFLDKPTNLFVNINQKVDEEVLLKFIYQIKCLEETGDINLSYAEKMIKTGFQITYHASPRKIETPRSKHIYMHTAKVILQAIGRICRTKNKNRNIFICYDCQMERDLGQVKGMLLKKQINHEFRELLNKCEDVNQENALNSQYQNINNAKSRKSFDTIERIREFRSSNDITKWEELRELVLKYPYDNVGIHNLYDIYCQLEIPSDHYYCTKKSEKEYDITLDKVNSMRICESLANLKQLMMIPEIEEFFISKGYVTHFEKSNYILLPTVFNKIYLGALGEVVGEYLINRILEKANKKLERITELTKYEKFDFVIDGSIYIDFKYWNGYFDKDREIEVKRVIRKLDKCDGNIAYIINILKPQNYDPKVYESPDSRLIIIPYLYDTETRKFNMNSINELKNVLIN